MKYKCLLADDNTLDRDTLEMLLQKMEQLEIVACCANGMQAAQELMTKEIDIVFSDIDMPELSGLGLLKSLKKPPVFIFVSNYKDHAAESFELDVVDFIVKPVMPGCLLRAINKAIEYIETQKVMARQKDEKQPAAEDFFFIRTSDGLVKLITTDVAYVESIGNFSKVFTTNGKFHITLVNLKNLEIQLPTHEFVRIHKQYLVTKKNILVINHEMITVAGTFELPLSPVYKQALLDTIGNDKIVGRQVKK